MSKLREQVEIIEGDLQTPAEGDLAPYVVFTQLTGTGPYMYAGWIDACDDAMAIQFACEHYGRDQKCTAVWAIPRTVIAGTEAEFAPSSEKGTKWIKIFPLRISAPQCPPRLTLFHPHSKPVKACYLTHFLKSY